MKAGTFTPCLIFAAACSAELSGPTQTTGLPREGAAQPARGPGPHTGPVASPPAVEQGAAALSGRAWWDAQCASCHGDFRSDSALSSGDLQGAYRLDAAEAVAEHGPALAELISATMPLAEPAACTGECAELTAAYIASYSQPVTVASCEGVVLPRAERFALLGSQEYQRSLEDLLGVTKDFGALVSNNDGVVGGFGNMDGRTVNGTLLEQYLRNAEDIAADAVARGQPFDCQGGCGDRFVREFLPRVFRGRVTQEQRDQFAALFAEFGDDGMEAALHAALSSPYFLYRHEAGSGALETASSLAFMLTGAGPDEALLQAARDGRLSSEAELRMHIERLLDGPAGRRRVGDFIVEWFGFEGVASVNRPHAPELTPEVRAAMVEEVRQHFLHIVYGEAPYSELYGGDYTFLNDTLARYYGVQGDFGPDFQRAQVEGRGGPIASGAFMTLHAHAERSAPIRRAVHAREEALCQTIAPPNSPLAGDDIDMQRALAQARVAEREQQEGQLSSRDFYFEYTDGIDACASCHEKTINPMFGMEDFDNVGRFRPTAGPGEVFETVGGQQKRVSLAGTMYGVESTSDPTTIEFAGAKDLSNKISTSDALDRCLVRKTFRWATGLPLTDRDVDGAHREDLSPERRRAHACLERRLLEAYEEAGEDPRALIVELALQSLLAR